MDDGLLAHTLAATAHQKLSAKRQTMQGFHQERLQRAGLAPAAQAEPAAVQAMPEHAQAEFYDLADADSDITVSPPPTPRPAIVDQPSSALEPVGRLARAGFRATGAVAGQLGGYAATSLGNNVRGAAHIAQQSALAVGQVAAALGSASRRAASVGAGHAQEAIATRTSQAQEAAAAALEPGSNTRRALAGAAAATGSAAAGLANTVGPPIAQGAYATAHLTGRGLGAAASGLGQAAAATGSGLMHVGQTHLVPAVKSLASRGLQLGSQALERATLNAAEIINTLDVLEQEGYFQSWRLFL